MTRSADGMNMYAYVKGDPVNFSDPSGLEVNDIFVNGNCVLLCKQGPVWELEDRVRGADRGNVDRGNGASDGGGKTPNDDADGDGQPDPDIVVTAKKPPQPGLLTTALTVQTLRDRLTGDCAKAVAGAFIEGAVDPLGVVVGAAVGAAQAAVDGPPAGGKVEINGRNYKLPPRGPISAWTLARRAATKAVPAGLVASGLIGLAKAGWTYYTDDRCK